MRPAIVCHGDLEVYCPNLSVFIYVYVCERAKISRTRISLVARRASARGGEEGIARANKFHLGEIIMPIADHPLARIDTCEM